MFVFKSLENLLQRYHLVGVRTLATLLHEAIVKFRPAVVVVDPITNLTIEKHEAEVKPTLMRLIDFIKKEQITAVFTSLTSGNDAVEDSEVGVSSLMDTWLLLRNVEYNGERNRTIFVLKSRGMGHSNQIREFVMSNKGIDLIDVYLGDDEVLTGTARLARENRDTAAAKVMKYEQQRRAKKLDLELRSIEAQISALKAAAAAAVDEANFVNTHDRLMSESDLVNTEKILRIRGKDRSSSTRNRK